MTANATSFVGPISFASLSKNPVLTELINNDNWNNHVELGLWADVMIVAPATASTISKMVNGQCDNLLLASYLSAKCPVFVAPAMDLDMWQHPSTTENIRKLESYGNTIIPVGHGELASGLVGDGRMAEPEDIFKFVFGTENQMDLAGKRILITAGPTIEPIDPVRFIGNHSTGKMGLLIAEECRRRGAHIELVLGPVDIAVPMDENIIVHSVRTAEEMFQASKKCFSNIDVAIFAAAVADYTPKDYSTSKIKKKEGEMHIELKRTVDIAAELGMLKNASQFSVGFALETNSEEFHAKTKLNKKNFDFIVLNSLNDIGAGFAHDTNKIKIFDRTGASKEYDLKSKRLVATDIIDYLVSRMA